MAHKSQYIVENQEKYLGNNKNIVCRSSWERAVCKWADANKDIAKWASEEVVINYLCQTDLKYHRYFIDFLLVKSDGSKFLVEVKPSDQTKPPKPPKSGRMTKSFKEAQKTWVKNCSKWKAAEHFAKKNGMKFVIWTEHTLKKLGIKIVS